MSKKRLTLGLIFMDQDLNSGEPMTKRLRGSNDDVNGFLLLPECYVREHPQICSVFTQNGFLIINKDQLKPFYKFAKNAAGLGLIKVYLYESSSASHNPLTLYVDLIHRETLSLLMKKNTYPKFMSENFVRKCEICSPFDQVNLKVISELLSLQLDIGYRDFACGGAGLFLLAVEEGQRHLVDVILERDATLVNVRGIDDITPLIISAELGNLSAVSLLIKKGADVNLKSLRKTALHKAARRSHFEIVQLLLENGASPHGEADENETPLFEGIISCSFKIVEILLKWGVNVNETNYLGKSALHVASSKSTAQIVEYLLKLGADVNFKGTSGETPIFEAVRRSHEKMILIMLDFGADFRLKNERGKTIFDVVISDYRQKPSVFQLLLENCAHDLDFLMQTLFIDDEQGYRCSLFHYWWRTDEYEKILALHAIQLEMLSSSAAPLNIDWNFKTISQSSVKTYKSDCRREVAKLKRKRVGNSDVTFFDVLTKNVRQLAKYSRNEHFTEYFNSNDIKHRYPIYGDLIDRQYHKGYFRKELLDRGVICLSQLSASKISLLPSNLKEEILEYLSNRDIVGLENVLLK